MLKTLPVISLLLLSACANILSDDALRTKTALALNEPDNAVRIVNRRYDGATQTYYTAITPVGAYYCAINGGTLLTAGMTNPPQCEPSGSGRHPKDLPP